MIQSFLDKSTIVVTMYNTTKTISDEQKIELPVFEDVQMGMSLGMHTKDLYQSHPIQDLIFLICAVNQLVNHVDKMTIISEGQYQPRIIIRTSIGSRIPLDPRRTTHSRPHTSFQELVKESSCGCVG